MKDIIVFDGAFGTYILSKGARLDFPEQANIAEPGLVLEIHREYIASGVNAVKTNTFAANSGLGVDFSMLRRMIQSGFGLATQAALNTGVRVFADIGPVFHDGAADEYRQIADIFLGCGAENFLFETLNDAAGLQETIAHIRREAPKAVVIASFAVGQDGYTKSGEYYQTLLDAATACGADYVGLNCICGPSHMRDLIKRLPAGKYNLTAMPNAGYPSAVNGRTVYIDNPDYYAEKLLEIYSYGVKVIGGCCGTTPEHIRRFTEKVKTRKPRRAAGTGKEVPLKTGAKSGFDKAGAIIALEIAAPVDTDVSYIWDAAQRVKDAGADFITVPDSPLGKTRANSFMVSSMIRREVGIQTIPHVCCRDKNQIAIKGDLIAASIEGISSVLVITGDPIAEIYRGSAKNVFGLNSFELIGFIKNLNGAIFSGRPYHICAALNTSAARFDLELERAGTKIAKGAECFFTQPIFTQKNMENLKKAKATLGCKILAGIMPPASYKNALFLNNEMPGIEIPEEVVRSLMGKSKREAKEISMAYAKGIVERIRGDCDGYYLMTPLKKIDFSIELIQTIRGK